MYKSFRLILRRFFDRLISSINSHFVWLIRDENLLPWENKLHANRYSPKNIKSVKDAGWERKSLGFQLGLADQIQTAAWLCGFFCAGPLEVFQKMRKNLGWRGKFNAVTGFLTCRKLFSNVFVDGVVFFLSKYSFRFGQRIGSLFLLFLAPARVKCARSVEHPSTFLM